MKLFFFGESGIAFDLEMFVEFNKGRTKGIYFDSGNFQNRKTFFIIYPSTIVPKYEGNSFYGTSKAYICAPSVFDFFNKQTTADFSKCPSPQFKEKVTKKIACTCKIYRRERCFIISILLICLFCPTMKDIITLEVTKTTSDKKIE